MRILLLEDDDDLRFVLTQVLQGEGYEVEAASRGQEAVEMASQRPFDLVVADIRMEGLDGLDALAGVQERQPGVRSLVVTGYSTEADSIRAIRLGVGDYLKKPFDLSDFLAAVGRLVSQRRQEQTRKAAEQGLLTTLQSALEMLARSLDAFSPNKGCLASSRLAGRLARQLGMGPEACQEVELATLVAVTGFDSSPMPPGLLQTLRHLDEHWDGSGGPDGLAGAAIPLEARVAAVALASARHEELSEARFDPAVLAALERGGDPEAAAESGAQRRGLISLAHALEASGDAAGAEQAYHHACGTASRESVEALLGLARLGRGVDYARQAAELARQVGPSTMAAAFLEAGVLLAGEEALDLFRQAGRVFQALRIPAGEARALLALHILGRAEVAASQLEAALGVLLQPEHAAELAASASWLLPFVLQGRGPVFERGAARMVREFPRELARQLPSLDGAARQALATAAPAPLLRIHSFGPLEVFVGEERVEESAWRGPKNKYLFAFLAAHVGRPVSEDVLIDHFWPEDVEKGRRSLYWATSVLRRCLRSADALLRQEAGLQLRPDMPRWHDWEELQLRASEPGLDAHRRVVALYRGPYLESCYMDWTDPLRASAQAQVGQSLAALMEAAQKGERHAETLEHSQRLLELDPCRQEAAVAAMLALLALGRPEEAVRRFESCKKTLRRELDLEPGVPLLEAYQRARLHHSRS